jgi:hypothetical protein
MLRLWGKPSSRDCDGMARRDFLQIGSMSAEGLTLPGLLRARAHAGIADSPAKDTAVVWLWLGGGATHVETFDPKMQAPNEYRSTVGAVDTSLPGVQIGGLFPKIAAVADHMAFVRSFAHGNSGHGGGTHWVMTGYNFPAADQGMPPIKPSYGSIVSRQRGSNNVTTGIPTFVRVNGIYGDGPAWLGAAYGPFDSSGQARNNMNLSVQTNRLDDRRALLSGLDRLNRKVDRSHLMDGLDSFETQAFDLILGQSKEAFDLAKEDPHVRAKYGKGLGDQLLLARRLCEAGCGFVTIHYGGWDMHGSIEASLKGRCPQMDTAVSAFVDDCAQRGLDKKILLVITGEFGRTPRVNGGAGRDHWAPLSTLAFSGGGLRMGQVVGESDSRVSVPRTTPIRPGDVMATLFEVLGIPPAQQYLDNQGRPQYLLPPEAKPIPELV